MHHIESSPPFRAVAPVGLALLLATAHLSRPVLEGSASAWRVALAAIFVAALLSAMVWVVRARRFVLSSEALQVFRVIGPSSPISSNALSDLVSVGVVGVKPLGNTIIVAAFRSGTEVRVPRYYSESAALFRALFSRQGSNIAAQGAA